jgi:hypothetical protein
MSAEEVQIHQRLVELIKLTEDMLKLLEEIRDQKKGK